MDQSKKTILVELMKQQSQYGNELAAIIKKSTRTVRTLVKELNEEITGASIESGSFGYRLVLEEPQLFIGFMQSLEDPAQGESRFDAIFTTLTQSQGYVKVEELCEELYLSRTQLKQELKEVRSYLESYDVKIATKAHYGLRLEGTEINVRRAIAHLDNLDRKDELFGKIRNIVLSSIENFDYTISDDILDNLVYHLYIAYLRVSQGQYAIIDAAWKEEIEQEREFVLADSIISLMASLMEMEYREEEAVYLAIHLCSKKITTGTNVHIDQEIYDVVSEILDTIEQHSKIRFSLDLNLRLALATHMIPLLTRIKYATYMNNPLVNEVKSKLIGAYELAIKGAVIINERYHCSLPEDEIAYFALHINLALEQRLNTVHKKKILLVCSSGVGSARLLEYFFKDNFEKYIQELKVVSRHELDNLDLNRYDCIFSTIPLERELEIPLFLISSLISHRDVEAITDNLKTLDNTSPIRYFPESVFFIHEEFATKEAAIHTIIEDCARHFELPDEFEQLVLEREELSSTEFNDLIAFPHSHKPVSNKTFVSVTILKKPLLWKNHKIRIILLSSIENTLNKELDEFYRVISSFINNTTWQWRLIQNPEYEELTKIIKEIQQS